MKFFLLNASFDHLKIGIKGGFIQQMQSNRLNKIKKGDKVVLYATRNKYDGPYEPVRQFVGIGTAIDDDVFDHKGFWRKNIKFYRFRPVPLEKVIGKLEFIKNKDNYGFYFMRGFREISEADYLTIKKI